MTLHIEEETSSRAFTKGQSTSRELVYAITGASGSTEESDVEALVVATAPATYLGRVLDAIQCEPLGGGVWRGRARYVTLDVETTFDTGGDTVHITQSLSTVASYAPSGATAPDFSGAIGVNDDRVEGVDVEAETYEWSETHFFEDADMTYTYRDVLISMRGRWNNASFRGFDAGEVKFLGATGSKRGDERWRVTFRFKAIKNISGATIAGITGITKQGWDYLWIRYADFADTTAHALVKRPIAVYVERVTKAGDFSTLLIGVG